MPNEQISYHATPDGFDQWSVYHVDTRLTLKFDGIADLFDYLDELAARRGYWDYVRI